VADPESSTTTVTTVSTPPSNGTSVADAASLIAAVATLVAGSTSTIMARLDENARGASERWRIHDLELERNRETITAKFLKIEKALDEHIVIANAHFAREHDQDLVMRARVQPVRSGVAWIVANWKTVGLVVALVIGWVLLGVESVEHILP
jgi:hypothetical protein